MTTNPAEFKTVDTELSAVMYCKTKRKPTADRHPTNGFARFIHVYDDATQDVINQFATGSIQVDAKALLFCRRELFKLIKATPAGTGGAV